MKPEQLEHRRFLLPSFIFIMILDWGWQKVRNSFKVSTERFAKFMSGEEFPTEKELKSFCETFKLSYSKLSTWDVTHVEVDPIKSLVDDLNFYFEYKDKGSGEQAERNKKKLEAIIRAVASRQLIKDKSLLYGEDIEILRKLSDSESVVKDLLE